VQTAYTYEPYGATTQTGAASANPARFTGREEDASGLYHYRARYYDPRLQRFMNEDPIGLAGGLNLHNFVNNQPTIAKDPTGLKPSAGFGGGNAVAGVSGGGAGAGGGIGDTGEGDGNGGAGDGPLNCFAGNFSFSWNATNHFFFDGWWRLSRTAIGSITAGSMARTLGSHTVGQALPSVIQHGIGGFSLGPGLPGHGLGGTALSVGKTMIWNGATVAAVLEAGIVVGSAADGLGQTLAGYCR
jgi:RHS repeat-associated protein